MCVCEVTGRCRSSSTGYEINSIRGQLLKGSTLFICIFFPTSGLSSCLPGEGNRMRLPVLFVVMWVLSVSVHVHPCGTCIPCVCLCVSIGSAAQPLYGLDLGTRSNSSLASCGLPSLPAPNSLRPFAKNRKVQRENICLEISPENTKRLLSILEEKN